MDNLENKINSILSDPQMMEKLSEMANAMGLGQAVAPSAPPAAKQEQGNPEPDLSILQKISGTAWQSNINSDQRSLLKALGPYLSSQRLQKLEKAMRAASMAKLASAFLSKNTNLLSPGR